MLSRIKKFFAREETPPTLMDLLTGNYSPEYLEQSHARMKVECEKRSQELLQVLPRGTASVVIAGPSYGDKHHTGDVIADSAGLLPWALHQASNGGDTDAARRTLPLWLMGADLSNPEPSMANELFHTVWRGFAGDFIDKGFARAWCPECNQFVSNIKNDMHKLGHDGVFHWFMDEWHCPAGHLIYRKKEGISVYSRKKGETSGGQCA